MITRENINELKNITNKIEEAKERSSELLRTAQDRYNHVTHKLTREGKEVEIKEKTLWDEVFYLGTASQAGQILEKAHPEVFEAYKEQDRLAQDLKKYGITEMGFDPTQMTLANYLDMTESLFKILIEESKA
jgi:hypothetical protein